MSVQTRITLIADYGIGDPAFQEVIQRLYLYLPHALIDTISVSPFDSVSTGFWIAQLGLNPGPKGRVIYHNCAPRKDNLKGRNDNEGEGLVYAQLPNDVKVIGVLSGYTLSFIKDYAECIRFIDVPNRGSQFRSRDIFPQAVAALANNDFDLLGEELRVVDIPGIPETTIAWIDGYGNIKTTIPATSCNFRPGTKLLIKVGSYINEAIFADGSFTVPEGTLAFSPGSSGWKTFNNDESIRWMELFLRGGNAWEIFGRPKTNSRIKIQKTFLHEQEKDWEYLGLAV